jgi:prolyl-tRNA editing enzyme YbaK/EbsC (Cys-tRNA(Pro) deacylase)
VQDFAKEKVNIEQICKTIIVKGRKTDTCYGILLRGNDRLDFKLAKKELGEEIKIADREDVFKIAEVEPGAVCPFILNAPLFVDRKVLLLERINCGSGYHLAGLEFKTEDLVKGKEFTVIDVAKVID